MLCEEETGRSKTGGMGETGATSGKDEACRSGLSGWIERRRSVQILVRKENGATTRRSLFPYRDEVTEQIPSV